MTVGEDCSAHCFVEEDLIKQTFIRCTRSSANDQRFDKTRKKSENYSLTSPKTTL